MQDDAESFGVELNSQEIQLLQAGLAEWGGPAHMTADLAVALGFQGVDDFHAEARRISATIGRSLPMRPADWKRALLATEIAFASDVFGSGVEWSTTVGISDETTIRLLRQLQRKLVSATG